jgi:hypothetical protein
MKTYTLFCAKGRCFSQQFLQLFFPSSLLHENCFFLSFIIILFIHVFKFLFITVVVLVFVNFGANEHISFQRGGQEQKKNKNKMKGAFELFAGSQDQWNMSLKKKK